ncbi:cation:dicarboxylase symporter family transporter [Actinomycetaceae bacterium WB03_NA08]|uniref:Cation:dicarboxylase symporter family transporter n=2 Tax=Scrofimicrobium canadense TaxID=2652290 RepID=A0A6N7VQ61_9ACTO|nr:cation:dicarboxylase symporter family transporter [Scrofimicrobium canadense]
MVIIAVIAGIAMGAIWPSAGAAVKPLGTIFVSLIKMMIAPVIFCTIVLGIGSVKAAATVGKTGGLALAYFITLSTFALFIGLAVGNIIQPGTGLDIPEDGSFELPSTEDQGDGGWGFIKSLIPTTIFSSLTGSSVLQTLFIALLTGFAVQRMGTGGQRVLDAIALLQKLVFRMLTMILWLAPIGAFGAIAGVVGETGMEAVWQLGLLMIAFYITCFLFVFLVLGTILRVVTGINVFKLFKYLAREFLLIVATSSSESALPNLMAKMEHMGVERSTVGVVVPTGYSFNLDGTAIYLTMASIFIADAMGKGMPLGEQFGLLVFMIIASKGAAGVTGAGIATLAAGLQAYRPDLLDGVGIIVGIDRFMSEARALTNFAGNAIATVVIGKWTHTFDKARADEVLSGKLPFDYSLVGVDEPDVRAGEVPEVVDEVAELPSATPYPVLTEQKR